MTTSATGENPRLPRLRAVEGRGSIRFQLYLAAGGKAPDWIATVAVSAMKGASDLEFLYLNEQIRDSAVPV